MIIKTTKLNEFDLIYADYSSAYADYSSAYVDHSSAHACASIRIFDITTYIHNTNTHEDVKDQVGLACNNWPIHTNTNNKVFKSCMGETVV